MIRAGLIPVAAARQWISAAKGGQFNLAPRTIVREIEHMAAVPTGCGDRFAGYAILGVPFASGHVLSLRRFPASSVGPGYTSVWHRSPGGNWTFYSTAAPDDGCARYFSIAIDRSIAAPIHIEWIGPARLLVVVESALTWEVELTESVASRAMNKAAGLMPESWWRKAFVLGAMGAAARLCLGTGRINLSGRTPNGHEFVSNPRQVWLVKSSRATIQGADAGAPAPLARQACLRDLLIPQRGVFAVVQAFLRAA